MFTTLGIILLTAAYALLAWLALRGIALYYGKKRGTDPEEVYKGYLKDNNTYFFIGVGMCAVTFVIACYNIGPALLLPGDFPSKELRGKADYFVQHLLKGGKAAAHITYPTEPPSWATGTWFWGKAWFFYCLLTFGYFWFAFSDEFGAFVRKMTELIRKRHDLALEERRTAHAARVAQIEAKNRTRRKGETETPLPPPPPSKLSFFEFAKKDVLMELIFMGAREFITMFRKKP